MKTLIMICAVILTSTSFAETPKTASAQGAELYFINLKDGANVKSPVLVQFGLKGMGVAPAGVAKEGTGHHHLLIDAENPNLDLPVPSDDKHKHFGAGQTETTIELTPGKHTLQLLLADQNHIPHNPTVISKKITINVKK